MITTVIAITVCIYMLPKILGKKKKLPPKTRTMSFNSYSMIHGTFPEPAKVPEPVINCVMLFEKCPTVEAIKESCKGLLEFDRFHSVAELSSVTNQWVFRHVDVDLSNHVITTEVKDEEEVYDFLYNVCNKNLPSTNGGPQWVMHRIVNKGTGISAVIARIHHVIGDGVSLVMTMNRVFRDAKGEEFKVVLPDKPPKKPTKSVSAILLDLVVSTITVLGLGLTPYDENTGFTSSKKSTINMSTPRRLIMFPTLRLDFVKTLKNKAEATVNDILLSATAGTIRRYGVLNNDAYLNRRGDALCRTLLPVALPRSAQEIADPHHTLHNKFVFVSARLPIALETIKERLQFVAKTMSSFKSSVIVFVQLWVQEKLLSLLPVFVQRQFAFDIFSRHSMVFSNVPGPADVAHFANEPIVGMQVIFPNLVTQCQMQSYRNEIFMNMAVDPDIITKYAQLPELFMEEIIAMAAEFGVDTTYASEVISSYSPGGVFGMSNVHGPAIPQNAPKVTWKAAAGRTEGIDGYVSGDYLRLWGRKRGRSIANPESYIAIEKDNGELKQSEIEG